MNAALRRALRKATVSLSRSSGSWLTALLLLVVLVPSACLLWFMNQAVQNERLAIRQKLMDAYRGHLVLAQKRLEVYWARFADELDSQTMQLAPPVFFASEVRSGKADAVVCYDAERNLLYPNSATPAVPVQNNISWLQAEALEANDPAAAAKEYGRIAKTATNDLVAARALQAQARCLVRDGNEPAAISVLTGPLTEERYRTAIDDQGRLIQPGAELMAIELLKNSAPEQAQLRIGKFREVLMDYNQPIVSSQRRFLSRELARLFPDKIAFDTLAAEELAGRYVETRVTPPSESVFRPSPIAGVWQFVSSHGNVVSLHETSKLISRFQSAVSSSDLPADIRIDVIVPGQEAESALLSIPAGVAFPGWRVALALKDQQLFETTTKQQTTSYVWIGALAVGTLIVLATLALGLVRRQMALTELRNDLVANVTHELKTPLASMRLLVETLLNSPQLHEPTAREYLRLIATENLRLSRLIENFLTFSRIERNKHQFELRPVPPARIVDEAAASVRERFQAAGCHFEVDVPPHLPAVNADPGAMVTVLVNLLDNAFKYSGDQKEIALSAGAQNGTVFFSVKDNGIGLSSRETRRIFRRFYQVKEHRPHAAGGCGLGLSIVQFIVAAHHGTVTVESEPQRGSTFLVALPASLPTSTEVKL